MINRSRMIGILGGGWGVSALLGAAVAQIAQPETAAPIEPPAESKYETRQLRRAAEKRARKQAKQAMQRSRR